MRLLRYFEKAKKGFACWWADFEWQLQLISKYVCSLHKFLISLSLNQMLLCFITLEVYLPLAYQYNQCWKMLASQPIQEQPLQVYHGQMIFYGKKRSFHFTADSVFWLWRIQCINAANMFPLLRHILDISDHRKQGFQGLSQMITKHFRAIRWWPLNVEWLHINGIRLSLVACTLRWSPFQHSVLVTNRIISFCHVVSGDHPDMYRTVLLTFVEWTGHLEKQALPRVKPCSFFWKGFFGGMYCRYIVNYCDILLWYIMVEYVCSNRYFDAFP